MEPYVLLITLVGAAFLGAVWLPRILHERPLSAPIFYVGFGVAVFFLPPLSFPQLPQHSRLIEHLTELVVIVALMGAGLKIDRPIGWARWSSVWRLLAVAMPVSIAGAALLGWWALGLAPASALLLGAVLAPTDPVLASDVQTGRPGAGSGSETRFALTAEAGLNDGLAFPFTNLALLVAATGLAPANWWSEWLLVDVIYKIFVGALIGWLTGWVLRYMIFSPTRPASFARNRDGILALSVVFLSYGLAELAHGYGFIAVFIAALTLRTYERADKFHEEMHDFSEQIEHLLMVLFLILFGGAISGGLLNHLTWPAAGVGLAFLFLIRPAAGLIGLIGQKESLRERAAIGFLGIRGVGSFFYLSHAVNKAQFANTDVLWSTVGLVVLCSIVIHGVSATPIMRYIERRPAEPMQPQHQGPRRETVK